MEQQVEDDLLVLQGHRREFARHSEDNMYVSRGQQFLFARLKPAQAGVALTTWTMPVTTRVIRDGDMTAVCAAVRQRRMASRTLRCCQVNQRRLRSRKESPVLRMISATSRGGRFMPVVRALPVR
jgi:hypothetical protein